MPRKRRISKLQLLSELRKLLSQPDTRIFKRKLKSCGSSTWLEEDKKAFNIIIRFDPRRDGLVRLVLHELLHIYTSLSFGTRMVSEMEEVLVLAWEKHLYDYIHQPHNEHLLESWSQSIERKIV